MIRKGLGLAAFLAAAFAASPVGAQALPPAPWIDIAPGQRLAVVLDGPVRTPHFLPPGGSSDIARGLYRFRHALTKRVGSRMLDFYPVHSLPLHLSGGAHTVGRRGVLVDTSRFDRDWMFANDVLRFSNGRGDPAVLQIPVATIGYQRLLSQRLLIGIEGGGMLTHAPGYRPIGAAGLLVPGQYLDEGRMTLDPMIAVYLATAL